MVTVLFAFLGGLSVLTFFAILCAISVAKKSEKLMRQYDDDEDEAIFRVWFASNIFNSES